MKPVSVYAGGGLCVALMAIFVMIVGVVSFRDPA